MLSSMAGVLLFRITPFWVTFTFLHVCLRRLHANIRADIYRNKAEPYSRPKISGFGCLSIAFVPVHICFPNLCRTPKTLKTTCGCEERKTFTLCQHLEVHKCFFSTTGEKPKQCISYQCPEDVDGEEGDGKGDEADSLQSALQLQVVLGSPQAQPARDGCQGRDEKEAGHIAQQGALLTARAWVLQPLSKNTI